MNQPVGKVGIATVTYNSVSVLDEFLLTLSKQTWTNFRVYAVDNASVDGTVKRLQAASEADDRTVVIANSDNLGFAEGTNQGIRLALADGCTHVLMLNNDITLPADFLEILVNAAMSPPRPVVAPKIYYHEDPKRLWFAGGRLRTAPVYSALHLGCGERDDGQFDKACPIDFAPGCCMLIEASVFRSVGMLDPRYFVYHEDVDFCLRLARAGIPIWYAPRAFLYHKVSTLTGGEHSAFSVRMIARNRIYYIRKNFSPLSLLYFASVYFAYLVIRWLVGREPWGRLKLKTKAVAEGFRL